MESTLIAVDLAKNVFEIAVSRKPGKVAERHRLSRARFLPFFAERQPTTVLLEATGSAHYWARELRQLGHQPVLLPPRAVKRYRDSSPITWAQDLADALLVVHGTTDDNVHPHHTFALTRALVKAGRPFEQAIYPGEKHAFGDTASRHFYERMEEFFDRRLMPGSGR